MSLSWTYVSLSCSWIVFDRVQLRWLISGADITPPVCSLRSAAAAQKIQKKKQCRGCRVELVKDRETKSPAVLSHPPHVTRHRKTRRNVLATRNSWIINRYGGNRKWIKCISRSGIHSYGHSGYVMYADNVHWTNSKTVTRIKCWSLSWEYSNSTLCKTISQFSAD